MASDNTRTCEWRECNNTFTFNPKMTPQKRFCSPTCREKWHSQAISTFRVLTQADASGKQWVMNIMPDAKERAAELLGDVTFGVPVAITVPMEELMAMGLIGVYRERSGP